MATEHAGAEPPLRRGAALADLGVAVGVLIVSAIGAWQATLIPSSLYAQIGPAFFAWVAVAMLAAMGVFLLIDALRGGWSDPDAFGEVDLPGGLWLLVGLVLNIGLIEPLGFIVASTMLFFCTAKAFGSSSHLRDMGIGFALASIAYVGFDRVLGYKIGSGLIERLI